MPKELVDLTMQLHHETEKAILVSDDGEEGHAKWLPRALIEVNKLKPNIVEVTMPVWLAEREGFA